GSSRIIQPVLGKQNAGYIRQAICDAAFVAELLGPCHGLVILCASVGESALRKQNLSHIQGGNPLAKLVVDATEYFERLLLHSQCARHVPHTEHDVPNIVEVGGYPPFIL